MHIEKYKIQACCAMILHYQRGRSGTLKRENIDPERTYLNYEFGEKFDYTDIKNMMETVKNQTGRSVRKDANLLVDIVVTAPPNVQDEREFFQAVYESLKIQLLARGLDPNTKMCGYVHMDETTPHMHFSFLPVGNDKNGKMKFTFKTICRRALYNRIHQDTENYCEKKLGYRPSLLIIEEEDFNKLLARADVSQEKFKQLKDKMKENVKNEIKREIEDLKIERQILQNEITEQNECLFDIKDETEELLAEKKVLNQKLSDYDNKLEVQEKMYTLLQNEMSSLKPTSDNDLLQQQNTFNAWLTGL